MYEPRGNVTTLQVGTVDGIYTIEVDDEAGRGRHFAASLCGSPVREIAVDPTDPTLVMVGCGAPGAGLYYSRDGGLTWESPALWPFAHEVWALSFDPHHPRIALAGTQPAIMYRSSDRGYTWEELTAFQDVPCRSAWTFPRPPHQAHVRKIAFDPVEAGKVLAAVEVGGLLRSADGGRAWQIAGAGVDRDVHSIAFWHRDPRVALAATAGGLFRSDDRGDTWRRVPARAVGRYVVALSSQHQSPWAMFLAARDGKSAVCRSTDGGLTWTPLSGDLPAPALGVEALALHPSHPTNVYYGGQEPGEPSHGCVFASSDNGDTWQKLSIDIVLPPVTRLAVVDFAAAS